MTKYEPHDSKSSTTPLSSFIPLRNCPLLIVRPPHLAMAPVRHIRLLATLPRIRRWEFGLLILFLLVGAAPQGAQGQTTVFSETFDDQSQFTVTEGTIGGSGEDYFLIEDGSDINKSYSGTNGTFLTGQDTDGVNGGAAPVQTEWTGIDISGRSDLLFTGHFGEVLDGEGDIDASDEILVEYRIDSGTWQNLIAFRNDGSTSNDDFREDTDFDGIGEGTNISSSSGTLVEFTKSIPGTGNTLDLRFTGHVDSGDEDFAVDGFSIQEVGNPVVQFKSNSATVAEGDGSTTLTVELTNVSPSSDIEVEVPFNSGNSSADPSDIGSYTTQTVTFSSGTSVPAERNVTVDITDDSEMEGSETAQFGLDIASGTAEISSLSQFDLTITDNDQPPSQLIISQYVETSSGSAPKGIELWNVSGSTIDFSSANLDVNQYTNGSTSATKEVEVTTGTLADGAVLVIGGSDLQTHMDDTAPNVRFINDSFSFNGNDALEIVLGGTQQDEFGMIGVDPGGEWTGNGVSTEGQNIQLLSGIADGSTGFTDPSTRFATVIDPAEDDQDLDGFGTAPQPPTPTVRFTAANGTVQESDGGTTLALEIINPPDNTQVSAEVAFNNGSSAAESGDVNDFGTKSVTFPPSPSAGDTETVTVSLNSGDGKEGSEDAVFDLQNVSSAGASAGSPSQFTLTIEDGVGEHDGDVMITEFMANPEAASDTDGEYVELYNATNGSIDITDFAIDGDAIPSLTIPPRDFVALCRDEDSASNGGISCDAEVSLSLTNSGTGNTIQLTETPSGTKVVDKVTYDESQVGVGQARIFTGTTENGDASTNWTNATRRERGYAQDQSGDAGSPGRNGHQQTLQPTAEITGPAEWRMLSAPMDGITPTDLAAVSLVQGIDGLPFSGAAANVYRWQGGTTPNVSWSKPTSATEDLTGNGAPAGRASGFIWYVFDAAETAFTDTPPFALALPGMPRTSDVTTSSLSGSSTSDNAFHLLGNPYAQSFDLSALNLSNQGFQTTVQVWDPSAGTYEPVIQSNTSDDLIGRYQGFFVERATTGSATLTFSASGRRADPIDLKTLEDVPPRIEFRLVGRDEEGAVLTRDEALTLHAPDGASLGWDVHDASKLIPLSSRYATAAFRDTLGNDPHLQSVTSVPSLLPDEGIELPVSLQLQGTDSVDTFQLNWPIWTNVPDNWGLALHDTATDSTINLRSHSSYNFSLLQSKAQSVSPPGSPLATPTPLQAKAEADNARFTLIVQPGPLPVELADFNVTVSGKMARLAWTTASETNNAGFHVLHRRPDAQQFVSTGFVEGHGTTDAPQHYRFRAEALAPGRHVFRLQQVDLDGSSTRTDTVTVQVRLTEAATMSVSPNPVRLRATASLRVRAEQSVDLVLYDMLGRRVRTVHEGPMAAGRAHTFQVRTERLPSGLYFLRARGEHFQRTRRLTVVR